MPDPTPAATDAPPPPHPHETRIVSLEQLVDEHGKRLTTVEAAVQHNEAVNERSRSELAASVREVKDNVVKMQADQKDMPADLRDVKETLVGTMKETGLVAQVREMRAERSQSNAARDAVRGAVIGAIILAAAELAGSLIYFAVTSGAARH